MRLVAAKSHPLVARTIGIAPEAQVALIFAVSGAVADFAGVLLGLNSPVSSALNRSHSTSAST